MENHYTLEVNGRRHTVEADGATPLLWVLRDSLDLTGTKYGCGIGLCGTCLVHIDGHAEPSCTLTLEEAAGRSIRTIEGLAQQPDHPVFKAWIAHEVSQCGYCQPGMLMAAAAVMDAHPQPTTKQLADAVGAVLCRCGTYPRAAKAVETLATGEDGQ